MKTKINLISLFTAFILLLSCNSQQFNTDDNLSKKAFINNPVTDTLFITLPEGYEDETCSISIRSAQADFFGNDIVINNKVWFNVRHLPSATYLVWIKVGDLYFSRRFFKEGPMY